MTDQTIPADEVRTIIAFYRDDASNRGDEILESLRYLLPPLPRPTLADMTNEEREACRWMQADVTNRRVRYVIANPFDDDNDAGMVSADGEIEWFSAACVTPRPDLPPLEWPGTEKPAPDLPDGWRFADHEEHGRVIVTNLTPNRDGEVYYVCSKDRSPTGFSWKLCDPEELTYLPQ